VIEVLAQLLLPVIRTEMALLREQAPQLMEQIQALQIGGITLARWLPTTQAIVQRVAAEFGSDFTTLASLAIGTAADIGDALLDFMLLLLITYFLSLDHSWLEQALLAWTPVQQRERVVRVLVGINQRLTGWVLGQIGRGLSFAVLLCIGLWLLRVPYAVTLGLIGGLLAIIPYMGGVVATVLGIASALTVSPLLALWTLLLFVALSVVEEYIISPYLFGQAIGLHPAVVLLVLIAGAKVGGVSGLFFSVPVAVIVATILSEIQTGFAQRAQSNRAG
jgi:predicted PurR-regulated permease PerM